MFCHFYFRMKTQRATIIELYCAGKTPPQIFKLLSSQGINRMLIQRTIKRYTETGSINDRKRCGRPRSATAPVMVKKVALRIKRNPMRSMRKMAREMSVSEGSMRNIVKQHLHLKSLKRKHAQFLTPRTRQLRLERSKALLQQFTDVDVDNIMFTDEKLFTIEASSNQQNDRILATQVSAILDDMRIVAHTQCPKSVMVWAGVSARCRTKLIFVSEGVKINSAIYRDLILEPVVKQAGHTMFENQHWTFQQDGAPAHRSNVTQTWLKDNIPSFITREQWPPNSPDLNPLDFSIWGILQARVGSTSHCSIDTLKKTLVREWNKIPQEHLCAAVHDFRPRLNACISKRGGHFE